MAVQVRYNFWYTFLSSTANQQREMANFQVYAPTGPTTANVSYFNLELNAFVLLR